MPVYPASLEFCYIGGSYSEQPVDGVLRTQMDAGPDKTRRRFTAVPTNISFTLPWMTRAEYATFKTFFDVDLKGGALSFTATHPITNASGNFRFVAPYRMRTVGKNIEVSVELELLP